jgi:DNA (cytosine-5)-methyltransferase 1
VENVEEKMRELIIDLFAGGGGASEGIERAIGVAVDIAINHDKDAIEMHKANHPGTKHFIEDVFKVNPLEVTQGRQVGLLWASPDCTHFSRAKGGKPVKKEIRSLAWVVVNWAQLVRPRVIILENVPEFKTWGPLMEDNRPDPGRRGETFNLWVSQLKGLGYDVEFRELSACDYGAPTIRKRLFMIARCDREAIVWPEATYGPAGNLLGLKPYRTAAECIDWSLPCPSIFERKRPLAEATLRRIAKGLAKYVIDASEPFIVTCNHSGDGFRGQGLNEPLKTITAEYDAHGLVMPFLSKYHGQKADETRGQRTDEPLLTQDTQNRFALVSAFLSKYFGGAVGSHISKPAPTVTAIDHNALVAAHLTKFYGTNIGSDMRGPVPTITGQGQHLGEVRAFLIKYSGCGIGQSCKEPMHTVTSKDRLGLVMVYGQLYQIIDIGLRMLQPRELARAQGFRDSYLLTGSKSNQVAKIGNSVSPMPAEALVKANFRIGSERVAV